MKKIHSYHVDITTRVIVSAPEDTNIFELINDMEYNFTCLEQDCKVLDEEMTNINVVKVEK